MRNWHMLHHDLSWKLYTKWNKPVPKKPYIMNPLVQIIQNRKKPIEGDYIAFQEKWISI